MRLEEAGSRVGANADLLATSRGCKTYAERRTRTENGEVRVGQSHGLKTLDVTRRDKVDANVSPTFIFV